MNARISLDSVVVATRTQVSCPLDEESAILNMENSVYYGTNVVGARVWNLVQQPRSIRAIRDVIMGEYDVTAAQCENDLLPFLEQMKAEGLLEISSVAAA